MGNKKKPPQVNESAADDGNASDSGEDPDEKFRISIKPPDHFDTKQPSLWPRWIRTFERYRIASGLDRCSNERQVSVLIYTLGEDGEDLFETCTLSPDDQKLYSKVVDALSQVFVGKRNVTYERAKFHLRKQAIGEPFDLFLADLVKLVEHCNYRDLKDELVKDRIVVGISDKELSRDLQEDSDLTLEKAIRRCRQRESVVSQNNELRLLEKENPVPSVLASLNYVPTCKNSSRSSESSCCQTRRESGRRYPSSEPSRSSESSSACCQPYRDCNHNYPLSEKEECVYKNRDYNRQCHPDQDERRFQKCPDCGRRYHSKEECPAKNITCDICQNVGHFAKHCRNRRSGSSQQNSQKSTPDAEIAYLG